MDFETLRTKVEHSYDLRDCQVNDRVGSATTTRTINQLTGRPKAPLCPLCLPEAHHYLKQCPHAIRAKSEGFDVIIRGDRKTI